MFYLFWVPSVILSIFFMAWLSCKSDESWRWFAYLFISGAILQFWPLVARYSKNIVFDAILYDALGIFAWSIGLMFWSELRFSLTQWIGTSIVLVGLVLIEKGN